jgi:hypothetical protein
MKTVLLRLRYCVLLSTTIKCTYCEGTPAFPLSPGPFPPIAREPRLSRFLRFPGPFPPIAREPRPSRFLLARSLPLRGNPGFPAFSAFLARSLPLRGNPGFPAFPVFLARSLPLRGNPGHPVPFHPPFPPTGAGRARSVQVRPERQKSQQSPGPTGTTVSTSRALLRHPPGALLQVTDIVPERFRRHQVPTPPFVHSLNKGPPPCCDTCLFYYPFSAP